MRKVLIDNFRSGIKKLIEFPQQHAIYAIDKYWFQLQVQQSQLSNIHFLLTIFIILINLCFEQYNLTFLFL